MPKTKTYLKTGRQALASHLLSKCLKMFGPLCFGRRLPAIGSRRRQSSHMRHSFTYLLRMLWVLSALTHPALARSSPTLVQWPDVVTRRQRWICGSHYNWQSTRECALCKHAIADSGYYRWTKQVGAGIARVASCEQNLTPLCLPRSFHEVLHHEQIPKLALAVSEPPVVSLAAIEIVHVDMCDIFVGHTAYLVVMWLIEFIDVAISWTQLILLMSNWSMNLIALYYIVLVF